MILLLSPHGSGIPDPGGGGGDPLPPGSAGLFTPPRDVGVVPNYEPFSDPLVKRALRHFSRVDQGRNVYMHNDGTITELDPDGFSVTWADIAHVWWGGHVAEPVDATVAGRLTNAGYIVDPLP